MLFCKCGVYEASILTVECLFEINFTEEHIKAQQRRERDYCVSKGASVPLCALNGKWNGQCELLKLTSRSPREAPKLLPSVLLKQKETPEPCGSKGL
ncbi:hypothetical protein QQF64_007711 [Cirrhinus molitorella]|uniref:Uncharacterized protein n=1 Tax=Cirrhinus molitorella TaxID=172907 RepID=A0ABR3MBJ5_9TELE